MSSVRKPRILKKYSKRRGEWAELQFMAKAAQLGLSLVKPWGDSARYDIAIDTGSRFLRVQIKSTTARRPEGCYRCQVRGAYTAPPYKPGDFDFVAIYVIPEDAWYIIPAHLILGKRKAVMLYTESPTSLWAPYKEAWHLLLEARV